MKKVWILFGFPLIVAVGVVLSRGKLAVDISKVFLAVTNPVETMEYINSSKLPQEEFAEMDNSVGNTAEKEEILQNNDSTANPFEGFDIADSKDADATDTVIETEHPIAEMTYASATSDIIYRRQNCYVKNLTSLSEGEVEAELLQEVAFEVEKNSDKPQILIMHTHATESYQNYPELFYDPEYSCRDTDVNKNMVSVGKIIADKLNALGYNTLHDATLHDYPSYNDSYSRSKRTVEKYLAEYPSIKVVLDVHRDAIERTDGTRIKPVVTINGKKYAQVMIISGADNGYLNMPDYKKNLRFASHFQNAMESFYPGLTRPILFDYRNYNQQLTTGSLLVEVGGHANTLEEAQNSATLIAYSLAKVFDNMQ